jgi:hypothetical protein
MKIAQILTVKANNFSGKYDIYLCKIWIRRRSQINNTDLRLRGAQAESNIYGSATVVGSFSKLSYRIGSSRSPRAWRECPLSFATSAVTASSSSPKVKFQFYGDRFVTGLPFLILAENEILSKLQCSRIQSLPSASKNN